MYRTPGQHWLDLASRVRFAGETLRPWPVTLLYALGASDSDDSGRVLLQFGGGHRMLDVLHLPGRRGVSPADLGAGERGRCGNAYPYRRCLQLGRGHPQ